MIQYEKLRVGMKVKLSTRLDSEPDTVSAGKTSTMRAQQGMVFTVGYIGDRKRNGACMLKLKEDKAGYWYSSEWLYMVEEDFFDKGLFEL